MSEIIIVEIDMEEGDPLGATPDNQFVIIEIQNETLAEGKLQVGDKILSINDREPNNLSHFYHLLNVAAREDEKAILRIRRDTYKATELDAHNQIPADRARFIHRREGFLYKMVSVAYQRGMKLGLCIKHRQNHVLVSNIKPGSLSARVFEIMDQILDVDGQPVTDTFVTETAIRNGFKKRQFFTSIIARPTSADAKREIEEMLNRTTHTTTGDAATEEEPSVRMAEDVHVIAQREIERIARQQGVAQEGNSILAMPKSKKHRNRPVFGANVEKRIVSDVQDASSLRHIGLIHSDSK